MGPSSGGERGELFREANTETVAARLGRSGAARSARLFPASYQVPSETPRIAQLQTTSRCPVRASGDRVRGVSDRRSRDFNLQSATLSGVVQVNGIQMAPSPTGQPRGALRFAAPDAGVVSRALSSSGPASYQVRLLRGGYSVGFQNATDCPAGAVPCQRQVLIGCEAP